MTHVPHVRYLARLSQSVAQHSQKLAHKRPSSPPPPLPSIVKPDPMDTHVDVEGDEQKSTTSSSSPRSSPQMMEPKAKKAKKGKVMESSCNCEELRYVECILETKDLWDKFHDLETEMIITKTGR